MGATPKIVRAAPMLRQIYSSFRPNADVLQQGQTQTYGEKGSQNGDTTGIIRKVEGLMEYRKAALVEW